MMGAIIGAVVGGVAVLIIGLLAPARTCPDCGEPLPKVRKPANRRQMLWGGWTCPKCGCEVDRKGRKVT
jgi:transposase